MTLRGDKFFIDDIEHGPGEAKPQNHLASVNPFDFIGDVQERQTSAPKPPQAPSFRNTQDGFPTHRKRNAQSRFKKSRQDGQVEVPKEVGTTITSPDLLPQHTSMQPSSRPGDDAFMSSERHRIDEENRQRLAEMSQEEIEEERAELLNALDPSLIQRLLSRATFEDGGSDADFPGLEDVKAREQNDAEKETTPKPRKSVKFAEAVQVADVGIAEDVVTGKTPQAQKDVKVDEGIIAAAEEALPFDSSVHFPHAPQPPSLDPSSDTFLEDLHQKYFPSLPQDPEKLEWMRSTPSNAYSASQSSLQPKEIRFSFAGTLIPPRLAAEIPVTAGLHHHGAAPDAAGYTIPELARLARSSVAAQRCVAFQTFGRLLYRLGRGEFGNPSDGGQGTVGAEDTMGELARGLWGEVEKEGVVNMCVAESEGKVAGGRHVSARAYATEAIWLWQKGGGRRWTAA
ncbi:RPAP1-like protein, partial [Delphinella strobiligena]